LHPTLLVSAMSKTSKIIQVVLLVAILAAGINLYLYLRERRSGMAQPKRQEVALDPDYYVTPKKLHPQDLKDAKELTRQPVWIREGYRFTCRILALSTTRTMAIRCA
jgi:hypothetical protein